MVMESAANANALVANIFPETVKDRILKDTEGQANRNENKQGAGFGFGARKPHTSFLDETHQQSPEQTSHLTAFATKPIADLFTHATVMFADISGFTAWSSVREPSQVFTLLEKVYASFDKVAKTLKVFKVETVGKSLDIGKFAYPFRGLTIDAPTLPDPKHVGDCYVGK
jgi:Adenylate and Guanylate cyclase catalytic domain